MRDRFFVVAFRWITTKNPDLAALEGAMRAVGYDWARLNMHTWVLRSERNATEISERLRQHISGEDSIFVIATEHTERDGWMPKWFWDWFKKPLQEQTALAIPSASTTNALALSDAFRKKYYVVLQEGAWKILVDGVHYGPYSTQSEAIAHARSAAQNFGAQYPHLGAQILVQGTNNQFRTEWTYGKDPYPPKG